MSYPFVGIQGIWSEYEKWDAGVIERALRDGHHIYLEEDCYPCGGTGGSLQIVSFENGRFRASEVVALDETVVYENESFLEFLAHVLLFGRDIL